MSEARRCPKRDDDREETRPVDRERNVGAREGDDRSATGECVRRTTSLRAAICCIQVPLKETAWPPKESLCSGACERS